MKNIMILGICRTGKTTFSKMIQREFNNYQIIEVDTIISALQRTVPNIPIGFIHDNLKENRLPELLNLLIQKNINKNGKELGFIINGDSIMPKDLSKYFVCNFNSKSSNFFLSKLTIKLFKSLILSINSLISFVSINSIIFTSNYIIPLSVQLVNAFIPLSVYYYNIQ